MNPVTTSTGNRAARSVRTAEEYLAEANLELAEILTCLRGAETEQGIHETNENSFPWQAAGEYATIVAALIVIALSLVGPL